MTQPREWPNNSREARDKTAELLGKIIVNIRDVSKDVNSNGVDKNLILFKLILILDDAHTGFQLLKEQGAEVVTTPRRK